MLRCGENQTQMAVGFLVFLLKVVGREKERERERSCCDAVRTKQKWRS